MLKCAATTPAGFALEMFGAHEAPATNCFAEVFDVGTD
jgi:hypothetical protein